MTATTALASGAVARAAEALTPAGVFDKPRPPSIDVAERQRRLDGACSLMRGAGIGSMLVEAGSTLTYFTGIEWWLSERLTAMVLAADGDMMIVTPGFEEPSIREMLALPAEVRVWEEDESPSALVAGWLGERNLHARPMAIDEMVRFFVVQGLRDAAPQMEVRPGAGIVNALRMIKSPAELTLMQHASDITIAAYRATGPQIAAGMSKGDIFEIMAAEMVARGGRSPSGGVQIGEGTALPHGSKIPEDVAEGRVILMDCGCSVDGYRSDISRTLVFGEPSAQQRRVWDQVHRGQEIVMEIARPGVPAGAVDDAVRAYYTSLGYGPRYRTPGLPHRTGHGIGLDVHEPINLVHGEERLLEPGMCFSNEPGLYIPGDFGVRLEDCFYITPEGARYFSQPPPSINRPFD